MDLLEQIKSILNKNDSPAEREGSAEAGAPPGERRKKKRFSHKDRKILVIDDSATVVATFGKILGSAGCVVMEASDAETGLDIARREPPDLIFLDIVLPGMNGFAALRQMRRDARLRNTPVIVISDNKQATEQFYVRRIGADSFMKKPFSRGEIFGQVETLVTAGKIAKIEEAPKRARREKKGKAATALGEVSAMLAGMTAGEARRQLASMGLNYANPEQFADAIDRGDRLAVNLFVIGRGIKI